MKDIPRRTVQLKGGCLKWQKILKRNTLKTLSNRNCLHYYWTSLQIFRTTGFYLRHVRFVDHDKSDMKEHILDASVLPTHTTCSEISRDLNGFIEEIGLELKIALVFVLTALPFS
jgi:hypothetical protein